MKKKLTINSPATLKTAHKYMSDMWEDKKYLTVTLETGKKRSLSLNAIGHIWYEQVSKTEGEYTAEGIKCLCKLHFGLPILRADDEEYNEYCVKFIDHLPYEQKVAAMKYLPCTSLMKSPQKMRYMEQLQEHYSGRVKLEFPKK